MLRKRKKIRNAIAILLLLIAAGTVWRYWPRRADPAAKIAAGYYLADGGRALIVIEFDPRKGLYVPDEYSIYTPLRADPKFLKKISISSNDIHTVTSVQYVDGQLHFEQEITETQKGIGSGAFVIKYSCQLVPSSDHRGDWDIQNGQLIIDDLPFNTGGIGGILNGLAEALQAIVELITGNRFEYDDYLFYEDIAPVSHSIPSYFHKIDDLSITDFFHAAKEKNYDKSTLALIRSLLEKHSDDPFLQLYELEIEAYVENPEQAAAKWREWREKFIGWREHPIWPASNLVLDSINHQRAARAGYDFDAKPELMNTQEQEEWLIGLADYNYTITRHTSFIEFFDYLGRSNIPVPDLKALHIMAANIIVQAMFDLLLGKSEQSLRKLIGAYRLGQNINADVPIIQKLMGFLFRSIAIDFLRLYALNADLTHEELSQLQVQFELLQQLPGQEDGSMFEHAESLLFMHGLRQSGNALFSISSVDYKIRHQVSDVKFQLLRAATAVRARLIATGDFPTADDPALPGLPEGMPIDHFAGAPLRLLDPATSDVCMIYSIGPDKIDNHAEIVYDPTNGATSVGDIIARIPREREYPFLRGGVKAKNAYELLVQFPNGLPPDVYAIHKPRPLSILESGSSAPLIIFSFGPNRDEAKLWKNGGSSKDYESRAYPTSVKVPPLPENTPLGRIMQSIFISKTQLSDDQRNSNLQVPGLEGYWELEPQYDPTNGATSDGDPFIELPAE